MNEKDDGFLQKKSSDFIHVNSDNIYLKHSVARLSAAFKNYAEGMVCSEHHNLR